MVKDVRKALNMQVQMLMQFRNQFLVSRCNLTFYIILPTAARPQVMDQAFSKVAVDFNPPEAVKDMPGHPISQPPVQTTEYSHKFQSTWFAS